MSWTTFRQYWNDDFSLGKRWDETQLTVAQYILFFQLTLVLTPHDTSHKIKQQTDKV